MSRAASALQPSLQENGYVILPNVIDTDAIKYLQQESQLFYDKICTKDLENDDCVIDIMATYPMSDNAKERFYGDAFMQARSSQLMKLDSRVGNALAASNVLKTLLYCHLPTVLHQFYPDHSTFFYFNDHYIIKPPFSRSEFVWHRDGDLQLAMCPAKNMIEPYFSLWCALDYIDSENGTIQFVPRCKSLDIVDPDHALLDDLATTPIHVSPGSVVLFASDVWHRSLQNLSARIRRVFYAQYSLRPITVANSLKASDSTILNHAIPCKIQI